MDEQLKLIREELDAALARLGKSANKYKAELDNFMQTIQLDLERALVTGDELSLNLLRDRAAGRLGRISMKALYEAREVVLQVMLVAVRILVRMGTGGAVTT